MKRLAGVVFQSFVISFFVWMAASPALGVQSSAGPARSDLLHCLENYSVVGKSALNRVEEKNLAAFDVRKNAVVDMVPLSINVYSVRLDDGRRFIVRTPDRYNVTTRESFASKFVNEIPWLKTPSIRVLTVAESAPVLALIRKNHPQDYEWLVDRWASQRYPKKSIRVSIANDYQLTSGIEVLAELGASDKLRTQLTMLGKSSSLRGQDLLEFHRLNISKLWNEMPKPAQVRLANDLRTLIPKLLDKPDSEILGSVIGMLEQFPKTNIAKIGLIAIERIEPKMRSQLADYWAAYTVLGIPDLHPGNWLSDGRNVFGIDLAHPPIPLKAAKPSLELRSGQHPFGFYEFSPELRARLMSEVTPAMRDYLKRLTSRRVLEIASRSGYPLSESELANIMTRISAF